MNGFGLYAEMKKKDSKIRACFITATDKFSYDKKQEDMTKEYCTLNKDMFLQKPISNKDLLLEINKRIRELDADKLTSKQIGSSRQGRTLLKAPRQGKGKDTSYQYNKRNGKLIHVACMPCLSSFLIL
jgi:YesN/AraC family two-component response regulator